MAIEKINLNNRLIEPDEDGIANLGTLIEEHQSLLEYLKASKIRFVTSEEWEGIQGHADPDTYYFVGQ